MKVKSHMKLTKVKNKFIQKFSDMSDGIICKYDTWREVEKRQSEMERSRALDRR